MDPEFLKGSKFEESIPPFEFQAELEEHNATHHNDPDAAFRALF